jgi:repressor LexA
MYANLDMLDAAGLSIPTNNEELMATAKAVQNPPEVWGFNSPSTVKDYGWYWFYNMIHNYGGDMVSDDMESATFDSPAVRNALQFAVDLRCNDKVQPPLGQYDREAALSLFKAGKLAMMVEEPSRVIPLEEEGLPLIGRVAAGEPILAQEHVESHYKVDPALFQPHADLLLRINGMSMKDIGILDGDLLAVHRTTDVHNGQVVVARVDEDVTVKRLEKRGREVLLHAENDEFAPIKVDLATEHFAIEGIAVGVIRNADWM